MRNIRCSKCNSLLAKEEGDRIILRTGFGKRQTYHTFNKEGATIMCWFCGEVKIERNNGNGRTFKKSGQFRAEPINK